ncbi:MAG: DUF1989 domain-containing protein [Micrococcaceae bacterium]|nr:DUF1989 domain-containing protein [Micrococcaceae bacterium]
MNQNSKASLTDAAYKGPALEVDREFYGNIATSLESRTLVDSFEIPIRSGRAWKVPAGHVCRILTVDGPQVGDLNLWNYDNPRERFWAARTRQLQAAHVTTFDRLWSTLPFLRPLATITADTLENYGVDDDGGRVHDTLGTRCDPYVNRMLTGDDFDYHCHSNLTRAVLPFGLTEFDVHDVLNVFQCTGLNDKDQYFMKSCPAKVGDHFEFFAEQDLLVALSTCPGGDLSVPMWGEGAHDPVEVCRPIGIEIHKIDDGILGDWSSPGLPEYDGKHGLRAKGWS